MQTEEDKEKEKVIFFGKGLLLEISLPLGNTGQ